MNLLNPRAYTLRTHTRTRIFRHTPSGAERFLRPLLRFPASREPVFNLTQCPTPAPSTCGNHTLTPTPAHGPGSARLSRALLAISGFWTGTACVPSACPREQKRNGELPTRPSCAREGRARVKTYVWHQVISVVRLRLAHGQPAGIRLVRRVPPLPGPGP